MYYTLRFKKNIITKTYELVRFTIDHGLIQNQYIMIPIKNWTMRHITFDLIVMNRLSSLAYYGGQSTIEKPICLKPFRRIFNRLSRYSMASYDVIRLKWNSNY